MKTLPKDKLLLPRPISWSGMTMLEKQEAKWILKYIEGKKINFDNSGIRFGRKVDEFLGGDEETDDISLAVIKDQVVRYELRKHVIKSTLKSEHGDIELLGELDTAKEDFSIFRDYKTGRGIWTQKKADTHGQFHFYATMIFLNTGKIPKCFVDWMQTEEINGEVQYTGKLQTFEVKITHVEIIRMKLRIIKNAKRIDYLVRKSMKSL